MPLGDSAQPRHEWNNWTVTAHGGMGELPSIFCPSKHESMNQCTHVVRSKPQSPHKCPSTTYPSIVGPHIPYAKGVEMYPTPMGWNYCFNPLYNHCFVQ